MQQISLSSRLKDDLTRLPFLTDHLPGIAGTLKQNPEHFQVEEVMPYSASGEGEHVYVTLKRKEWNTADVGRELQRTFALRTTDVGWAGRKDKKAVTTQTFSLRLPMNMQAEEVAQTLDRLPFQILNIQRHRNKIKTGHVAANRFNIIVSQVAADALRKAQAIAETLKCCGIANYYGQQRFGWNQRNLDQAESLVIKGHAGRSKKDQFNVSVLQSALFNKWLGHRIDTGKFNTILQGDVARKTDTGGMFIVDDVAEAANRLATGQIVYTGPIYGYKMMPATDQAGETEKKILAEFDIDTDLFKRLRAPGSRRSAQLMVDDLMISQVAEGLSFRFALPAGAYATMVLREFMRTDQGGDLA